MNLKEFERSLSDFSTGYETYIKLMSDIKRLDNLIQANEKQSNAYPTQTKQALNN